MKPLLYIFSFLILLASCGSGTPPNPHKTGNPVHTSNQHSKSAPSSPYEKKPVSSPVAVKQTTSSQPAAKTPVSSPATTASSVKYSATEIFDLYNTAVFMIYTSDGVHGYQGSGFFINSSGLAVSNYHVFRGTNIGAEQIRLSNGAVYKIKEVVAKDAFDDVFVFQVEGNGHTFNYIPMSNRTPKIGEEIFTIGSPLGLENTFSIGNISQLRDNGNIQISAPIDHGSSGGALINEYGEVIGITTSGIDDSGANLNFAKSISLVKKRL